MAGVEEMDLGIGNIALEGVRARWKKERIVLAPDGEERWTPRAEILLEFRIEGDIALVVTDEIELDLVIPGPCQQCRIQGPGIGRKPFRVRLAVGVLPARRFRREKGTERRAVLRRRVLPIRLNGIPALA